MNCRIEKNWPGACYDIWFYEPDGQGTAVMQLDSGLPPSWRTYDPGEETAPTLRLHGDALEALLAEAEKVIPASHATERHLTDAISVRDRLLTLVEHGACDV